uniref:Uncharacterized protein n=1 Tax=Anguilla anguilla TaxID=7936 RepID=A0A0E9TGL9_ANGAN
MWGYKCVIIYCRRIT